MQYLALIGFIVWRIIDQDEITFKDPSYNPYSYSVIGNLLPEIAGVVIVIRPILCYLITPFERLNFYLNMI